MTPTDALARALPAVGDGEARCGFEGCGHRFTSHRLVDHPAGTAPVGWCNECEGTDSFTHYPIAQAAAEAADREAAGDPARGGGRRSTGNRKDRASAAADPPWYAPLSVWPLRCDDCGEPFSLEHYGPGEHRIAAYAAAKEARRG